MVTNDIKYILNTHVPTVLAALMLFLAACSDEQYDNNRQQPGNGVSGPLITVTATQGNRPQTRLGYDDPNNHLEPIAVTWAAEDQFYVGKDFSVFAGSNTYLSSATEFFSPFTLSPGGEGSKSAEFTGNRPGEAVDGEPLYAFYGDGTQCIAIEKGTLSFDYTKQQQSDNDNKDHLSKADFMVATTTETGRQPVFAFTRLGAMMKFIITLPEAGLTVTKLTLTTTDGSAPFSTATQWNKEAALTSTSKTASTSTSLKLGEYSGITLTNQTLTAYMMVAPTTLTAETSPITGKKLKLQVAATNRSVYTAILNGADIEQGNYYTVKAEPVILPEEMSFTIRVVPDTLGFAIPFGGRYPNLTPADITVDWGDGNTLTVKKDTEIGEDKADYQFAHKYTTPGEYTITISSSQMDDTQKQIPEFHWKYRAFHYGYYNKRRLIKMNTPMLNTGETSFEECFYECSNLTSLSPGLFSKNKLVTKFNSCFYKCTSLTSLPEDLFRYNTLAEYFYSCFRYCKGLTSLPDKLFKWNKAATKFGNCFNSCSLTSVPQGLFDENTNADDFEACFRHNNLQSVPQGLFDKNTNASNFRFCFATCENLTSVPERLFCNVKYSADFNSCFNGCTSLESLPEAMFPKWGVFSYCFSKCTSLKSLPDKLFYHKDSDGNYTPTGGNFTHCFEECTSLASLPEGLFVDKETKNFSGCFYNCYNLVLNDKIFISKEESNTYFYDKRFRYGGKLSNMNFQECFFGVGRDLSDDQIKNSKAPELWRYNIGQETITTGCFSGTKASNIAGNVNIDGSFSFQR